MTLLTPRCPYLSPPGNQLEVQFILLAARAQHDQNLLDSVLGLLKQPIRWDTVKQLAAINGVLPLVFNLLKQLPPDQIPSVLMTELEGRLKAKMVYNMVRAQGLVKLLEELRDVGIVAIPYKGPVLAKLLYGNLALRSFCDLDLWVDPSDYTRARRWLEGQGFICQAEYAWECALSHPKRGLVVDLHRALSPTIFPFKLSFEAVKARSIPLKLSGQTFWQLSPEDLLLVLCIGWCKDCWSYRARLIQICDIAELLRTHPDLDWDYIQQQTLKLNAGNVLRFPLALAHQWLMAPIPELMSHELSSTHTIKNLVDDFSNQFWDTHFSRQKHKAGYLPTFDHQIYFALRSRLVDRLQYLTSLYSFYLKSWPVAQWKNFNFSLNQL